MPGRGRCSASDTSTDSQCRRLWHHPRDEPGHRACPPGRRRHEHDCHGQPDGGGRRDRASYALPGSRRRNSPDPDTRRAPRAHRQGPVAARHGRPVARASVLAGQTPRWRGRRAARSCRNASPRCEALRAIGLEPDHWDVHQHLHEYPGLGGPITEAMLAESVLRARNPRRAACIRAQLRPRAIIQARRRAPMAELVRRSFTTPDSCSRLPRPLGTS